MGRFARLVDTPEAVLALKARYHIPHDVSLKML